MGTLRKTTIAAMTGLLGLSTLSACGEGGQLNLAERLNLGGPAEASDDTGVGAARTTAEDVEAPEVFSLTEEGLWDGRPSLGGIWVAHPDVTEPERVIIRNTGNGRSVVGALFRRETELPGPRLQVSSDAAAELDLVAGAPQALSVIALRRKEVPVEVDEVEEPADVTETTLEPAEVVPEPDEAASVHRTDDPDAA